jgi:hypothetical protein
MFISFLLSRKRKNHTLTVFIFAIITGLAVSCGDSEKRESVFLNGKIVNSRGATVIFTDYGGINDTIALTESDEFEAQLKGVRNSGLYTFWHGTEYQSLYLEPGDSVTLFVDTKYFDESLAFSHNHAKENNYLITMFTEMEAASDAFLPQYKKEPDTFLNILAAKTEDELAKLHQDALKQKLSKKFVSIATDVIWFNAFNKKERYLAAHHSSAKTPHTTKLPTNFYDHRKSIDLNNTQLLNNNSFKAYLNSLITNITRDKLAKNNKNSTNLTYATTRLQVINELLKNDTMRELYLANYTRNVLRNARDHEMPQTILKTYLSLSTDKANHELMKHFAASFKVTRAGNGLEDLLLKGDKDNQVMLGSIVEKKSVVYYWSTKDESYNMQVHLTVADLRKKYPEFGFIGINTDDSTDSSWKEALNSMDIETLDEYQVAVGNNYNLEKVLKGSKRAMLIDKDLTILDGNLNLLHYKIETTLLGYASK